MHFQLISIYVGPITHKSTFAQTQVKDEGQGEKLRWERKDGRGPRMSSALQKDENIFPVITHQTDLQWWLEHPELRIT